jgi:hypothetical protein
LLSYNLSWNSHFKDLQLAWLRQYFRSLLTIIPMNKFASVKTYLKAIALAGFGLAVSSANAHTITIGTYNAGSPGSVTVAMGTYTSGHSSLFAQGSITLVAGPSAPAGPVAFGGSTLTKPILLDDGVNNFFPNGLGTYNALTNSTGEPITNWQTATFTGLTAGTYTYTISGMTAVNWANWDTGAANWTGTLVIPGSSVTGVPDSGSSFVLLGLALAGLTAIRRRNA